MKTKYLVIMVLAGTMAASLASAQTLGVGAGGGVAIPLSKYMDAAPVEGLDPSGASVKNSVGFSFHAELLASKWFELRYSMSGLGWSSVQATNEAGQTSSLSTSGMPLLMFHSLTVGARINFLDGPAHLYIPVSVGPTFVQYNNSENFKGQYGVNAQSGLEFDYELYKGIRLGIGARYQFYLTNKPEDVVQGTIVGRYKRQYAPLLNLCSKSPTDPRCKTIPSPNSGSVGVSDLIAMFHSVTVNANVSFGF